MKIGKVIGVKNYLILITIFVSVAAVLLTIIQILLVKKFYGGINGKWQTVMEYKDNKDKVITSDIFAMDLKQKGTKIEGGYCFKIGSTKDSDCEPGIRINGMAITKNTAEIAINSLFSSEPVKANLEIKEGKLILKTETPNATIPYEVTMEKIKE